VAAVVGSIERHLRFVTSGSIQGYPVQRATLVLRGERVELSVLRDADGTTRLAVADDCPTRSWTGTRGHASAPVGPRLDCAELVRRLRRDNYVAIGYEGSVEQDGGAAALAAAFAAPNALALPGHSPGDLIVQGIVASPGKAAGFARLGTEGRPPEDLDGAILFAPAVRPEDTPLLRRCAAVVSTGGGILSHAGLIALELHKPGLVISGRWHQEADGTSRLAYRHLDFVEEEKAVGPYAVSLRRDLHEREETLREGDLVVVDAEVGTLTVLGRDRDALALQQELRQLEAVAGELGREEAGPRLLVLRGRWHRAVHQLKKLLSRIDRPALARHAARELLFVRSAPSAMPGRDDIGGLLRALFANPLVGEAARQAARRQHVELSQRYAGHVREALRVIPIADGVPEILHLRLRVLRVRRRLDALATLLNAVGIATAYAGQHADLDLRVRRRLEELRAAARGELADLALGDDGAWAGRHLVARLEFLDRVLPPLAADAGAPPREASFARDRRIIEERFAGRPILTCGDGGRELTPIIGSKGANLGEIARILGPGRVPPWFAVTDAAFQAMMAGPPGKADSASPTLAAAIEEVLARPELRPARKAAAIRQLWEAVSFPPALVGQIDEAYRLLGCGQPAGSGATDGGPGAACDAAAADDEPCFVAIRSSAFEEDSASTSWAGQFDTFLFIRGAESVRDHLKLAMASLWTERAIVQREQSGDPAVRRGGGVIVQRIVDARVAGVLHTLSAAAGQSREMVINVGLGLGEGVVSGTVEVDHVIVSREHDLDEDPLRVRYLVGDKSSRVVFDRRAGSGTRREETLYHQRLRAALEYSDLGELVRAAARLERTYGFPLDIEFAFEEAGLFILQVRPIVAFQNALRETVEQAPLASPDAREGKDGKS
jgi:pyruvate,water dikinase